MDVTRSHDGWGAQLASVPLRASMLPREAMICSLSARSVERAWKEWRLPRQYRHIPPERR